MEPAFRHLLRMFDVATQRIAPEHFQLPVADADAVYRERVYCCELYHQLRCAWGGFPYSLGGEIDKSGNPHFQEGPYSRSKPDLLVHTPGEMDANLAAVEVKPATAKVSKIRDDIKKLAWFCQEARYFRGIFLVYGDAGEPERLAGIVRSSADSSTLAVLECLYHRRLGFPAQRIQL